VAAPVSVATFPIGSAGAACVGEGAAAGAGVGVAAGAGAVWAGCACANPVEPDIAPKAAGISSASIGDGIAITFAVPPSITQPRSQIANGSRYVITTGS
jgi:hypothetical protein